MNTYYRVETFCVDKNETTGGFVSVIFCIFRIMLEAGPEVSDDELAKIIAESTDPNVIRLFTITNGLLGGLDKPEIYISDKPNHFCLYNKEDFCARYDDFQELSEYVDDYCPMFRLAYSEVTLPPEVILYEDENQIVISKADYEKYRPETPFFFNDIELEDDDDEE